MSKEYIRTSEMHGKKPFNCPNCRKKMMTSFEGHFKIILDCPRCKCNIIVNCHEAVPCYQETLDHA